MHLPTLAAAALAFASLAASAQTLKPGLWELRHKMNNPQLDAAMAEMQQQMAAMPPEQRKQMEAMLSAQGVRMTSAGKGGGMAVQMCMTKEMVERNEMPMESGCKTTQQQRSGNTTKFAYVCSNPPSSGEGEFTHQGPEGYSSRMTVKSTIDGKTETTTMEGSGRWLKADCGSVKPMGAPKS